MENINFILAGLFVLLFGLTYFNDKGSTKFFNPTPNHPTAEQFNPPRRVELPYHIPSKPDTPRDPQKQLIDAKADPHHADIPQSLGSGKVHPTLKDNWQQVADATGDSFYIDPTTGCDVWLR